MAKNTAEHNKENVDPARAEHKGTQFDPNTLLKRFPMAPRDEPVKEDNKSNKDFKVYYNKYLNYLLNINKARYMLFFLLNLSMLTKWV